MTICRSGTSCLFLSCVSAREILYHWKYCNHNDCPVCKHYRHPISVPTRLVRDLLPKPSAEARFYWTGLQGGPSLDVPRAGPSSSDQEISHTDQILNVLESVWMGFRQPVSVPTEPQGSLDVPQAGPSSSGQESPRTDQILELNGDVSVTTGPQWAPILDVPQAGPSSSCQESPQTDQILDTNYGKIKARKLRLGLILHAHQCRKARDPNEVS